MRFSLKLILANLILLTLVSLMPAAALAKDSTEKEMAFAQTVLLGTEYGGDGRIISRWKRSPTLSVFGGSADDAELIEEIVGEINQAMAPSKVQINIVRPGDTRASFKIYLVPKTEFYEIARQYNFQYVENNDGYFHIKWNGWHQISQAIVLIRDSLKGRERRHFMFEEITQAMGLASDSNLYRNSIFYAKPGNGGRAKGLSDLDKRLIHFLYNYLEPGDTQDDLLQAFHAHWAQLNEE